MANPHDYSATGLQSDVSRRGFLRGAGALAATPLLAGIPSAAAQAGKPEGSRLGPGPVDVTLKINGEDRNVKIEPRTTLLEVLRDGLQITGAKEVCDRGACGACTVHLNGRPINSCMLLALDAVGAEVTTIESLSKGEQLDPVPAAFARHDAFQCGFCTPGFVMSVKALLQNNPTPTIDDVRHACSGNLCRCGTYPKIFEAALTAAGIATPVGNEADNKGKALQDEARVDGALKASGRARYTADIYRPNMAYASILYCPYGNAKLVSFDEDAARKVPGVLDVSVRQREEYKYCGQPTGHICAESRHALADGITALALKWEVGTPRTNALKELEQAGHTIPPPLEESGREERRAEVKEAFEKAARTVEQTYMTSIQTHVPLETHGCVAESRDSEAELWHSTQGTGSTLQGAAQVLDLPRNNVTIHCEYVGAGFGSKLFGLDVEGKLACELSKKLGRPVKVMNDRKREHLDCGCRPGSIQYMKVALDKDGQPAGGQVFVAGVAGPGGGGDAANPSRYKFGPIVRSSRDVTLSVGSARPMRAPGHPQAMFAVDSFVDELAEAAGMDPLDFRKKIDPNETRKKMYDLGAERIGWKNRRQANAAVTGKRVRGIGVGVGDWGNGKGSCQVRIDVHKDGTVRVVSGVQDIGTGTRTVLADVVADHLKIDRKLISADCGNSDYPPGPASGGSTVTRVLVPAIRDAADKARDELQKKTSATFADTKSWIEACRKLPEESLTVVGSFNDDYWGVGGSECVQFAEVEVDRQTGQVFVKKVVALQACGLPVNRLAVENQVIGGVVQGISFALFEEKIHDPRTGMMVNPNIEHYKILGAMDCPEIIPIIWKEGDNLGARSVGEPPVVPTAGAVANAIANAIGARVRSLPITPAKVLAALSDTGGV